MGKQGCQLHRHVGESRRLLLIFFFCTCSVGHNEVIGVCRVGNDGDILGRKHWSEMLTYPRKPVAHWHPLVEVSLRRQWRRCCVFTSGSRINAFAALPSTISCRLQDFPKKKKGKKKIESDYHSSAIKARWLH